MKNQTLLNVELSRKPLNIFGFLILLLGVQFSSFSSCPGVSGVINVNGVQTISSLFTLTGNYCQVNQNIDIMPGSELIIDQNCEFYENIGINVHIGAELTLGDISASGNLTMKNKCDELWSGITAITGLSTSSVSIVKSDPNFNFNFTIEKALTGIKTPLSPISYYGAKVDLHEVTFVDCNQAMELKGKSLAWNELIFDKCKFTWTDDYKPYQDILAQGLPTLNFNFPSMILIAIYKKCTFLNCEVQNDVDYAAIGNGDFTKQIQRGTGVEMIDAYVKFIASDCLPSSQYCLDGSITCYDDCTIGNGNLIKGFGTGIHCKNDLNMPHVATTLNLMTLFENNVVHYKSEESLNSYTYGCWFRNDPSLNWTFTGIYFDKCKGFTIEKNEFVTIGSVSDRAWRGIQHIESGSTKCVVRNNGFLSGNSCSDFCTADMNVMGVGSYGNTQGLEFTCNSFNLYGTDGECHTSFITDWYIGPNGSAGPYNTNPVQGDINESAANNFTGGCSTSATGYAINTDILIRAYEVTPCLWYPVYMTYYEFGSDGPTCYYDKVNCSGASGSNITFPQSNSRGECNSEACISTCGTSSGDDGNNGHGGDMMIVNNIYPNPTSGVINIEFSDEYSVLNEGKSLRVELFGLINNSTFTYNTNLVDGMIILNLSEISNGINGINIYDGEELIYMDRIIKE